MQEIDSRERNELLARLSSKRRGLRRIDLRRRRPFDAHHLRTVRSRAEAAQRPAGPAGHGELLDDQRVQRLLRLGPRLEALALLEALLQAERQVDERA